MPQPFPLRILVLICLALHVCFPDVSVRAAEEKPVSWVNPRLPEGPGLTHHVLDSQAMGHEVGYVVWTPKDFDASGNTRYPVIYFLHGMGGNESADAGGFSGLLAQGIREGDLPPVICVFPNGGRSGYRGTVEAMIVNELIPLIDNSYPTQAGANNRAVAGFSMGGAGAVQLSVLHPGLFCVAGSWGGGLWREADALLEAADRNAGLLKSNRFSVLLVNGEKGRPDAFKPLAEKLTRQQIPHEVVILPDTPHNLGLYYQRAGRTMTQFLGKGLRK